MKDSFKEVAANENNPKWENIIKREKEIYKKESDLRSDFERDYNRIINSTAYRRLKHKTQVFFSPSNDHICTRQEHVAHVESISYTIAKFLGLNVELTKAIATAHDIGHSPFGHRGERILSELSVKDIGETFWHEKNGLDMVDKLELLEDSSGNKKNMNLTYGVRDGIISHCGEIDENMVRPRVDAIDLKEYKRPNEYSPFTWEGCVVKIADKISYLGRDIEDAITLGILDEHLDELYNLLELDRSEIINNTVIINELISDLCENSSPEKGLCFSEEKFQMINKIKKFNYKYIYLAERISPSNEYIGIVIKQIYNVLKESFEKKEIIRKMYPKVMDDFENWIATYWNLDREEKLKNDVIFNVENKKEYYKAIIYYISGMTDNYAVEIYNRIVRF